jgi:hypothetical protein
MAIINTHCERELEDVFDSPSEEAVIHNNEMLLKCIDAADAQLGAHALVKHNTKGRIHFSLTHSHTSLQTRSHVHNWARMRSSVLVCVLYGILAMDFDVCCGEENLSSPDRLQLRGGRRA